MSEDNLVKACKFYNLLTDTLPIEQKPFPAHGTILIDTSVNEWGLGRHVISETCKHWAYSPCHHRHFLWGFKKKLVCHFSSEIICEYHVWCLHLSSSVVFLWMYFLSSYLELSGSRVAHQYNQSKIRLSSNPITDRDCELVWVEMTPTNSDVWPF